MILNANISISKQTRVQTVSNFPVRGACPVSPCIDTDTGAHALWHGSRVQMGGHGLVIEAPRNGRDHDRDRLARFR
jgi:hypothetical protein